MRPLCLLAFILFIQSPLVALAAGEFVVVEWANQAVAQRFSRQCGISLEKLPVNEGSHRLAQRLTPEQLDSCEGLTRKLSDSSLYRKSVKEAFAGLNGIDKPLPLLREGALRTVENVSAQKLAAQIEQVQFFEFPWGFLKPDVNRRGFVFLSQPKKIIVNSLNPGTEALEKHYAQNGKISALLLHEALQAMGGYYDRYYEFSTALWLLAQVKKEEQKAHLEQLEAMAKRLAGQSSPQLAGGCSLVCGGGDGNEAYFKILLLNLTLQRKEFQENPKIQRTVIWKIIASEIHEILPAECELLKKRGTERCSIFGDVPGKPGAIYFVGDWLEDMGSVSRMVEAATLVLKDICVSAQVEELRR